MKRIPLFLGACCLVAQSALGQSPGRIIVQKDVTEMLQTLAADHMEGRKIFTPGIEKASRFIENQFAQIGLDSLKGQHGYRQEFHFISPQPLSAEIRINDSAIPASHWMMRSTQAEIDWTGKDSVRVVMIGGEDNLFQHMQTFLQPTQNTVVLVDEKFKDQFSRVKDYLDEHNAAEQMPYSTLFILHSGKTSGWSIHIKNRLHPEQANNVVGVLPGKTKPDEYVIFSAHYDHLGIGKPEKGDSVYNGANDDASGSTAVIELAKYFKTKKDNNRTLIFVTFTGEEEGGLGSGYFSKHLDPNKVVAMVNIEMIGTDAKWGNNAAYITGFDRSDLGTILQKNLEKTNFHFYPDPYTSENLFYRSDNATLAKLGVPAHTISTSKMDDEPNYHKPSDEISTLNLENMTRIICAIALSAESVITGQDTPTRVQTGSLK